MHVNWLQVLMAGYYQGINGQSVTDLTTDEIITIIEDRYSYTNGQLFCTTLVHVHVHVL